MNRFDMVYENGTVYRVGNPEDGKFVLYSDAIEEIETLRQQLAEATKPVQAEPVYQLKRSDGSWFDQLKASYDYNVRHGYQDDLRILYTAPTASPVYRRLLEAAKLAANQIRTFDYTPARSTLLCAIAEAEGGGDE